MTLPKASDRAATAARDLEIEYLPTATLVPDPDNARKPTKKQIERLAANMRAFGFTNPVLFDEAVLAAT